MRILFVIHTWHPEGRGGSEHHARELALALQERGHQVGVFTRASRPDQARYEVSTEWQGPISVTRINNMWWEGGSFEWMYKNRRVHEAFEREIESFQPDLVHVHHLTGLSTTLVEELKRRGIPVVMTLHDFWMVCPRGQRMTKDLELCEEVDRNRCFTCLGGMWPQLFAEREAQRTIVDIRGNLSPALLAEFDRHMAYVLNLCDLLVCPSEFHRERMLDFPIDPERIVSLPHGVERKPFHAPPREPGRLRTIGYIGTVIPVKGVHVLIEAFKKLGRPDLTLVIHGESRPFHDDSAYQQRLEGQARGMDNVVFAGAYDPEDVPDLLQDIDVLVVPSLWWESYCITLREGLLAGVPVVASDLGAMREALDGEENGVLFRPGDADDLARLLRRFLEDEAFRARYQNRGACVKSLDTYVDEMEGLYARAAASAEARKGSLAVAPPSFPAESSAVPAVEEQAAVPGAVPWNALGVAVRHEGPLDMRLVTRKPTAEKPALGLDITLHQGDQVMGEVGVVVDMRALVQGFGAGGNGRSAEREEAEASEEPAALGAAPRRVRRSRAETAPVVKRVRVRTGGSRLLKIRVSGKRPTERLSLGAGRE